MSRLLSGLLWITVVAAALAAGCSDGRGPQLASASATSDGRRETSEIHPPDSPASGDPTEQPFETELLKVASEYLSWGRVDDWARWAPGLCSLPPPPRPHLSASADDSTHGQKLYSLFARNRNDYLNVTALTTVDVGQVLVKQSWIPEEITDANEKPEKEHSYDYSKVIRTRLPPPDPQDDPSDGAWDHFYPYVWKEGKVFKASRQADLFIMLKLDPTTPGTDAGWVYGTVTPDGKTVTSAGKVESCMHCHVQAKGDRLFGLAAYREDAALLEIRRLGGEYHFNFDSEDWRVETVALDTLEENRADDRNLILVEELPGLKRLLLDNSAVTDEGMDHLAGLNKLEELGLSRTRVGDEGVAKLARLGSLQTLNLNGTQVTDAGLGHFKGLTSLKKISFVNTRVTDAGVADLKRALPGLMIER